MTASRNNLARPPDDEPRSPLAMHECRCWSLALPHSHQLGDHDTDLAAVAATLRAQAQQRATRRVRRMGRAAR